MIFPIGPINHENDLAIVKVQKPFQKTNWVQTIAPLADPHTYPSGINFDLCRNSHHRCTQVENKRGLGQIFAKISGASRLTEQNYQGVNFLNFYFNFINKVFFLICIWEVPFHQPFPPPTVCIYDSHPHPKYIEYFIWFLTNL
jgi:hypothetical protein